MRNVAGIVMGVAGAKEKIDKVWPLRSERRKPTESLVMTKDMYEQIKKAHNL